MDINKQIDLAIRLREDGNLKESRKFFEGLLKDSESLASGGKNKLEICFRIRTEWIIQLRHEGRDSYKQALGVAEENYKLMKKLGHSYYGIVRGISNTLMNLEGYELAEKYLRETVKLIPDSDSARQGDILAHLARCIFRQGHRKEASGIIEDAVAKIETNSGKASNMHIAVWLSHALMVKSLLFNSFGRFNDALKVAKEALKLAESEKVRMRIDEARELINYLESKLK